MFAPSPFPYTPMAKPSVRHKVETFLINGVRFIGGALVALLLVWSLSSFADPNSRYVPSFDSILIEPMKKANLASQNCPVSGSPVDLGSDPENSTFYDDPNLSYSLEDKVKNWDEKRAEWLKYHPSFAAGVKNRVLLLTGSQSAPCKNPIGDNLLMKFFKNKVDYCRIHGHEIFFNFAFLHPKMNSYWAKLPLVRAAMLAHPEVEWIWWIDSDALITDMEFKLPLDRYAAHNLVVHGWPNAIYNDKSWTGLNAGIFLMRNCQWSMDFMDYWASMGPMSPEFKKWGPIQKSMFKDKMFPESDDQTALIYILYKHKDTWGTRIHLEMEYYFEGYWIGMVPKFDNITEKYTEMEMSAPELRRRHAEKVTERYGELREVYLKNAGIGKGDWRRPFITHFTGCQPCSGNHNPIYEGDACWNGMEKAFNFADNQVVRNYGFIHSNLNLPAVAAVAHDYPS